MPEPLLPVVISNTSPRLYLHRIHQLHLLEQLYTRVRVPEQVADELHTGRNAGMTVPDVTMLPWCDIHRAHLSRVCAHS